MSVFIVETDNGGDEQNYCSRVEGVFASYRAASEFLMTETRRKEVYLPFPMQDHTGQWYLNFEGSFGCVGWITEYEVQE